MPDYNKKISFAENVKAMVASSVKAVKKSWSAPGASSEYHKERDALVQGVTDAIVQGFKVRYGISEKTLQSVGQHIIDIVSTELKEKRLDLQNILEQDKSKGDPRYVVDQFKDSALENNIVESVWSECKDAVIPADLWLAMIEQMKKEIVPASTVALGEYKEDRDMVLQTVVDQALSKLQGLSSDVILKHRERILSEFKVLSSRHTAAIKDFLVKSKGAIPKDYKVMWYSKVPIQTQVSQQVVGNIPTQYDSNIKRQALDNVMSEIRGLLKDPAKGGFEAVPWLKYGRYSQQRDALVDQMVDDIKEKLRRDPSVTAEMLYNNRDEVLKVVKTEVQKQKKSVETFLKKSENKGKDFSELKQRWRDSGKSITDEMSHTLSNKLKENVVIEAKMERALSALRDSMTRCGKEMVGAIEKKDKWPWTSSEYHVERDVMVQAMVDSTIDSFAKKSRLSEGFLKINHDLILKSFQNVVTQNQQEIEARMHDMVAQTKSSRLPFLASTSRAQEVLTERIGETKDLDVVEDIAVRFGQAVKEVCKGDVAQEEAQRAVGGLSGARLGVGVSNLVTRKEQEKGIQTR